MVPTKSKRKPKTIQRRKVQKNSIGTAPINSRFRRGCRDLTASRTRLASLALDQPEPGRLKSSQGSGHTSPALQTLSSLSSSYPMPSVSRKDRPSSIFFSFHGSFAHAREFIRLLFPSSDPFRRLRAAESKVCCDPCKEREGFYSLTWID